MGAKSNILTPSDGKGEHHQNVRFHMTLLPAEEGGGGMKENIFLFWLILFSFHLDKFSFSYTLFYPFK